MARAFKELESWEERRSSAEKVNGEFVRWFTVAGQPPSPDNSRPLRFLQFISTFGDFSQFYQTNAVLVIRRTYKSASVNTDDAKLV